MSIMKMVYQAGLNNGLSPNQARAFTAEVGRENDFNPSFIFGEHRDSNRDNVGIISWNQGRRSNLYSYLQKRGISTKNGIERSQRSLNAQMGFAIHEMKTNPAYKATKRIFLDNPNVDYRTAEKVLGKNFIRWDYAGNSLGANVRSHHNKRDKYYAQLGGVVKDGGYQPQQSWQAPSFRPAAELKQIPSFVIPKWQSSSDLKGEVVEPTFQAPKWNTPEKQEVAALPVFKAPEWQTADNAQPTSDSRSDGFKAPEWNPPVEQEMVQQPSFKPPEFMPAEQLTTNNNTMPELEPQEWQT